MFFVAGLSGWPVSSVSFCGISAQRQQMSAGTEAVHQGYDVTQPEASRTEEIGLELREEARDWHAFADRFDALEHNIERVLRGKHDQIRLALVALVAEGHLLIEDVPGVGKTMLAKAMARSIDCSFRRIQFTPDMLPTDITGVNVFNQERGDFEFRPGAVFANVVLGDEINRASPKTQSALLECMEERQVTIDAETHTLGTPFIVVATQNPVEHEGTYPLPEAQLDRFMIRLSVGYPDREVESEILATHTSGEPLAEIGPVCDAMAVAALIEQAHHVHVAPAIRHYIVGLTEASRSHADVYLGASPRASIMLLRAARAFAAAARRDYVVPDDVKALAHPVLGHRIIVTADAAMTARDTAAVIADLLATVDVPLAERE
jgi:MoxR-like ATPase